MADDRGEGAESLVLHKVEAEVQRGEVAELVGGHGGAKPLEEVPAQPGARQVDLLSMY